MDRFLSEIKKKDFFLFKKNLLFDNIKYYLKKTNDVVNIYKEFLAYELGNKAGVNIVKPYSYVKNNRTVMVSEDFVKDGYKSINGSTILEEYIDLCMIL